MADLASFSTWVPVGLGQTLPAMAVQRCQVLDQDLAVWRGADGVVRAWQNRCPHRGMRLSFGFVRENRLTCVYHGWAYDGSGACVAIPAHPTLEPPKTITVERFSCIESQGLIFVAPEAVSGAPPTANGNWIACRSIAINAPPAHVTNSLANAVFLPFTGIKLGALGIDPGFKRYSVPVDASIVAYGSRAIGPHVLQAKCSGSESILCGVQPVAERLTVLHLLFSGAIEAGDVPRARHHYAQWAKRLRLYLESGATREDKPPPAMNAA
jgi:nitrite reductase/ring-hydroxylating ferredoxin subunit